MNLYRIRPKNKTEVFLLSVTKYCGTPIEETHKKQKKHLNINLTNQKKTFRLILSLILVLILIC